jgi:hypothetical protein
VKVPLQLAKTKRENIAPDVARTQTEVKRGRHVALSSVLDEFNTSKHELGIPITLQASETLPTMSLQGLCEHADQCIEVAVILIPDCGAPAFGQGRDKM